MSTKSHSDDEDTSIGSTEMRALRRIADPIGQHAVPQDEELWASRYRIAESLGHGGMGDVFLARDILLDRPVALKILRMVSEETIDDNRRLLREARAAARAEHERVARIYDVGSWRGQPYIAMEYVRGETLRAWMRTRRPTTGEVVSIIQQLLEGLQALHGRGLVHRDLKPENVMVTPEGNLRILDLGVARRVAIAGSTGTGDDASISLAIGVGTPGYMAPEQWRQSDIDARADIFALGVIAYELIASRGPFNGSSHPIIRERTLNEEVSFDADCWTETPAQLRAAVQVALCRDREHRFQRVEDMMAALGLPSSPATQSLSLKPMPRDRNESAISPTVDVTGDRSTVESIEASALGMSIRVLAKKRPVWLVAGVLTVAGLSLVAGLRPWSTRPALAPPILNMVSFPGASYSMGLEQAQLDAECISYPRGCDPEAKNEVPPRPRTVAPFAIDIREVTNEEFAVFLTSIGSLVHVSNNDDDDDHYPRFVHYHPRAGEEYLLYDAYKGLTGLGITKPSSFRSLPDFEQLPVTLVTWLAAHLYCKSVGKRLPIEGEWELAARGLERRPFPWGTETPRCGGVHIPSNRTLVLRDPERCENDRAIPFPVMSAPQDVTPEGVHDMGGNVVEWVDDDAMLNNDSASYATRASVDKPGVVRGGGYNSSSFDARTTARSFWLANNVARNLGFRCATSNNTTK